MENLTQEHRQRYPPVAKALYGTVRKKPAASA